LITIIEFSTQNHGSDGPDPRKFPLGLIGGARALRAAGWVSGVPRTR